MSWETLAVGAIIGLTFIFYKPILNFFKREELPDRIICPMIPAIYSQDSITWKTGTDASVLVTLSGAALLQMLHPDVVRLVEKNGSFYTQPEKRSKNTLLHGTSIIYGNKEIVDHACKRFNKLHQSICGIDSKGNKYNASDPKLLLWVHNSVIWMMIRGYRFYGPKLTFEQEDQYVLEQNETAETMNVPRNMLPNSMNDIEKYMIDIIPELCLNAHSLHYKKFFLYERPSNIPIIDYFILYAGCYFMMDFHQELFGMKPNKVKKFIVLQASYIIIKFIKFLYPPSKTIPKIIEELKVHSY